MRKPSGPILANIFSVALMCTFMICSVSYTLVGMKVRKISKAAGSWSKLRKKYNRMAHMLTLFVVAYMMQWFPAVVQGFWTFIANPHVSVIVMVVFFTNIGGVFNCVAYTVIRLKYSGRTFSKQTIATHNERYVLSSTCSNNRMDSVSQIPTLQESLHI